MRAGARLRADSADSQTTSKEGRRRAREREEKEKKKALGKGCNVTRGGTKQLSVFCHMNPPRNTYVTESVDPAAMGVSSFCRRQNFTATSLRVDVGAPFSSSLFPRVNLEGENGERERETAVSVWPCTETLPRCLASRREAAGSNDVKVFDSLRASSCLSIQSLLLTLKPRLTT